MLVVHSRIHLLFGYYIGSSLLTGIIFRSIHFSLVITFLQDYLYKPPGYYSHLR